MEKGEGGEKHWDVTSLLLPLMVQHICTALPISGTEGKRMLVEMGKLLINPLLFPSSVPEPFTHLGQPWLCAQGWEGNEMGERWPSPPWRNYPQTPFLAGNALSDPTAISHVTFRHICPAFPHISMHCHTAQHCFPVTQFLVSRVTHLFLMPVPPRPCEWMVPSPPQLRAE